MGTFALACRTGDASALMPAMATDVGRQIEGNLTAMLGTHERTLIQAYLLATRTDRQPVIVVTESTAFANTAGVVHVTPEAQARLWCDLAESGLRAGKHRRAVRLPGGLCDALVERVDGVGPTGLAFCVRLLGSPRSPDPPCRPTVAGHAGTPQRGQPCIRFPTSPISSGARSASGRSSPSTVPEAAGS